MKTLAALVLLLSASPARCASTSTARAWQWRDNVDLSVIETSGNSVSRTISGGNAFEAAWPTVFAEAKFTALQAKTRDSVTAEKFVGYEKARWHWTDDNYLFQKFLWKRDRFMGLRYRFDGSAGVGRRLFKTKNAQFMVEAGGGQILEHEIADQNHRGDSYKSAGKFSYAFPQGAYFEQDAEYTHDLRRGSDSRYQFNSSLNSPLTKRLSLKMSFEYEFNNAPPPGILRVDRMFQVGLSISLGSLSVDIDESSDYGEIGEDDTAPVPDPPPAAPASDDADDDSDE